MAVVSAICMQGCSADKSADELFRETLTLMEQAAQQKDVKAFMHHVSKNYQDSQARSWQDIRRIAQIYFLRNKTVHIYKHVTRLDIIDDSAEAIVLVAMAGQPIDSVESLINIRAELMRFKVQFEFDGGWRVRWAEWKPAGPGDFGLPVGLPE